MHKLARTFIPLLLLTALLAFGTVPARAASALWIGVDQAPVRIWRSAQAEVVLRLARGTVVEPLYVQGAWTRVREPAGQEGWVYQGHLSASPLAPALAEVFAPAPPSMILAEAAETDRSTRSNGAAKPKGVDLLQTALELRITPDDLDEFLSQGGIGEYAKVQRHRHGRAATFPAVHPAAPSGGEDERQVGLNMAAEVLEHMARPAFGTTLQRYVNLVGLAVARFAPAQQPGFRAIVLETPAPVSFSLPGGIVMLSTGLLAALENEAQLAAVLAHETAHASLSHLWATALRSEFLRNGGKADRAGVGTPQFAAMVAELLDTALSRGIDAHLEFEADLAAAAMLYRAGYDPQQLPRAIERIHDAGKSTQWEGPPKAWDALHPPMRERIARLARLLVTLPGQDALALATERYRANR